MTDVRPDPSALLELPDSSVSSLRHALKQAGYDASFIGRAESIAPGQLDQIRLPLVHAWLRTQDEPAAVCARLFAYRDGVQASLVRDVLGGELVDTLIGAGALRTEDADVRSKLRLMPFAGLILASDEADARHDPVMGPGATTLELWSATAVPAGGTVVDVGCGAGSLALAAAAAGACAAVGLDLDPRAVAYGRFNARLNEISNVSFHTGDLLAPVAGRTFDLIVSQPPFVTQPPDIAATTYLHGGERGDELSLKLIAQLPEFLAEDGRALVLFDSAPPPGETLMQRIATALGATDSYQVLAVSANGHGPDQQAVGYAAATHGDLGVEYARAAVAYRDHLRRLGVATLRHVLLEVSRPSVGARPYMAAVAPHKTSVYDANALDELRRGVRTASGGPEAIRAATIRPNPYAHLAQERPLANLESAPNYRVRFTGGRASDQDLSEAAAALLELFAIHPTVDDVVGGYAELCETTPAEVGGAVLKFVADSLVSGLLVVEAS